MISTNPLHNTQRYIATPSSYYISTPSSIRQLTLLDFIPSISSSMPFQQNARSPIKTYSPSADDTIRTRSSSSSSSSATSLPNLLIN